MEYLGYRNFNSNIYGRLYTTLKYYEDDIFIRHGKEISGWRDAGLREILALSGTAPGRRAKILAGPRLVCIYSTLHVSKRDTLTRKHNSNQLK
jgi:hypothetical protein